MSTLKNTLERMLNETDMDRLPLAAVVEVLANHTRQTKPVIYGTLCHIGNDKILNNPDFANGQWAKINDTLGAAFVRKSTYKVEDPIDHNNYDCPEKTNTRKWVFNSILDSDTTLPVVTMGGKTGHDVKYLLQKRPNTKIYNIERDDKILAAYLKHGYKTTSFVGSFSQFIDLYATKRFSIINYDTFSYLCESTAETLEKINKNKNTETLIVTFQNCKKFRNIGKYQELLRELFGKAEDPTKEAMTFIMSNYTLEDEMVYGGSGSRMKMRMFKFKRKS